MDHKHIPISLVGPGSQPVEEDGSTLEYMDMPSDMARYSPPHIPEPEAVRDLHAARQAMDWLRGALADWRPGSAPILANLSALDSESRELVNQVLGEGEVGITWNAGGEAGEVRGRTQESILTGIWRTLYLDSQDRVVCDLLEVAEAPHLVELANTGASPMNASPEGVPDELPNVLPILVELEDHARRYAEDPVPHSLNLTLLPLSEAEIAFIDERLGRGPIDVLSRAYGKCQVISTRTANVWWVRYYNAMGTPILNTLEVIDLPQVVQAAPEDIADSRERLEEILEPYWREDRV